MKSSARPMPGRVQSFDRSAAVTRSLIGYGVLAGPFYLAVGIVQGVLRDGFDFSKHALSHLANGPGGWVQTANFGLTGAMVVAAAVGIAHVIRPQSRAFGWFLGFFGACLLAGAIFRADPIDGFPVDTQPGIGKTMSVSGVMHFASGAMGFIALAISAFVMARVMSARGVPGLSRLSVFAGVSVIGGFFAPMLGLQSPVAGIWFAVVVGWAWLAVISAHLYRAAPSPNCEATHSSSGQFHQVPD